jgi:perosamine synthetase
MACTDNDEYAENMRTMSLHGISKDAWKRYSTEGSWYYEVIEAGYKYNMTDIAAALGFVQLKKCDEFYRRRASIARKYSETLRNFPEIKTPVVREYGTHAWHLYVIQLEKDSLKINRSQFIEEMKKNGIGCSVHFIPLHLHPFYVKAMECKSEDFPVATRVYERIVSPPIYPKMTDEEVEYVIQTIDKIVKDNKN